MKFEKKRKNKIKVNKTVAIKLVLTIILIILLCVMVINLFSCSNENEAPKEAPPVDFSVDENIADEEKIDVSISQSTGIAERENEDFFYDFTYAAVEKLFSSEEILLAENFEFHQTITVEYFVDEAPLSEVHYGYFTGSGRLEAILLYDTSNIPYFGSKLLMLFDVENSELLTYKAFPGHDVYIYMLENYYSDIGYILFMGVSWHQGIPSAQTQLASFEGGTWNSLPLPREDEDLSLRYTYDESKRQLSVQAFEYVFEDDNEYPLVIYIGDPQVYDWSGSSGLFEITTE